MTLGTTTMWSSTSSTRTTSPRSGEGETCPRSSLEGVGGWEVLVSAVGVAEDNNMLVVMQLDRDLEEVVRLETY